MLTLGASGCVETSLTVGAEAGTVGAIGAAGTDGGATLCGALGVVTGDVSGLNALIVVPPDARFALRSNSSPAAIKLPPSSKSISYPLIFTPVVRGVYVLLILVPLL